MISPKMRNVIIGVVTSVWAVSILASIVAPNYKPDSNINAIFMAVVGSLFASSRGKANSDDSGGSSNMNEAPTPDEEKRKTRKSKRGGTHRE